MLIAAPLAFHVPLAALGAVLAVVCWNMIEKPAIAHGLTGSWRTAVVLLVTFSLTIFFDLIAGIAAGVIVSILVKDRSSKA
jgi:SulP family sulfate permease